MLGLPAVANVMTNCALAKMLGWMDNSPVTHKKKKNQEMSLSQKRGGGGGGEGKKIGPQRAKTQIPKKGGGGEGERN